MRARNARLRMHQLSQVHVISKTEREKEGKRQSICRERNRCVYIPFAVWGVHRFVWEGVVPRVREREQRRVRVSGKVAHPENQG